MKLFYRLNCLFFNAWFRLLYDHQVYGREHLIKGKAILAPNHASYFDPPIIAASCPEEVSFLARKSLFNYPVFGKLIRSLNAHPVSGGAEDLGSIKLICQLLKEERQVVIFPEGRRTNDGSFGVIKPGIGMLALRCRAPIVPVYIGGTFAIWNKMRQFPHFSGKTVCVFGSSIDWKEFEHMDKKRAQEAMAGRVAQSIDSLKTWYEAGAAGTPP